MPLKWLYVITSHAFRFDIGPTVVRKLKLYTVVGVTLVFNLR
jgi:hypothetical protein